MSTIMGAGFAERPELTTDLKRCKADLERSGYCLLADALTPDELREAQERLTAQAAAERERGVAYMDGTPDKNWARSPTPMARCSRTVSPWRPAA